MIQDYAIQSIIVMCGKQRNYKPVKECLARNLTFSTHQNPKINQYAAAATLLDQKELSGLVVELN